MKAKLFVSTHSRPKAAGILRKKKDEKIFRFNTQPPEGGWGVHNVSFYQDTLCFNTQPPEGGWVAGAVLLRLVRCFNTQPPEGGWSLILLLINAVLSFNTQPPEGGWVKFN